MLEMTYGNRQTVNKLPLQPVMLGLGYGLGLKANFWPWP